MPPSRRLLTPHAAEPAPCSPARGSRGLAVGQVGAYGDRTWTIFFTFGSTHDGDAAAACCPGGIGTRTGHAARGGGAAGHGGEPGPVLLGVRRGRAATTRPWRSTTAPARRSTSRPVVRDRHYINGGTPPNSTYRMSGTLADGEVFVVGQRTGGTTVLAAADETSGAMMERRRRGGAGQGRRDARRHRPDRCRPRQLLGVRPTSTQDHTLRRKGSITDGRPGRRLTSSTRPPSGTATPRTPSTVSAATPPAAPRPTRRRR